MKAMWRAGVLTLRHLALPLAVSALDIRYGAVVRVPPPAPWKSKFFLRRLLAATGNNLTYSFFHGVYGKYQYFIFSMELMYMEYINQ